MRRAILALTGIVGLLVGASSLPAVAAPADDWPVQPEVRDANAVVAVVDTGINPYHETFRDDSPQAKRPPWTYIEGYPKNATRLDLTLDAKDYWTAVKADCKRVWSKIKPGKLYWVPGTKIVGAITFAPQTAIDCKSEEPSAGGRILDNGGHGTMTASRATSSQYGACQHCDVVAVQFSASIPLGSPSDSTVEAVNSIEWAAKSSAWIDLQSNSWGPFVPGWDPTGQAGLLTSNPELVRAVQKVSEKHLAFWASGNGAAFRGGVAGHPTLLSPHLAPDAIIVGGNDSGYFTAWSGFPPHIVSDACNSWAARYTDMAESADTVGSGTSSATPFAAGGAARILLEARSILGDDSTGVAGKVVASGPKHLVHEGPLVDGKLTLEEWKRLTFVTATPRPQGHFEDGTPCDAASPYGPMPVAWNDIPDGYPEYLHIGYGAVDADSFELAAKVMRGKAPVPDRTATDEYFTQDRAAREALYDVYTAP
ncbi:MAG TPA: S8 family serine peptidase [Actinomycetota bacterium]